VLDLASWLRNGVHELRSRCPIVSRARRPATCSSRATMRAALLLSLSLFACTDDAGVDDDTWSTPGKADDPITGGVRATRSEEVRLLDGFNALLDTSSGQCLEPAGTTPEYSIGAIDKPFDLMFVSKKEDLVKTLGIDIGLKIKYGAASIGPSADFVDNFKQSRMSTHLLVAARASYRVTNNREVKLTAEALDLLSQDPRAFLHRCGNFFVNGVELEAQLFVMIRIDALTEEAVRAINADLGLGAATALVGFDATVKTKLERIATRADVAIEVSELDRGFLADGGTTQLISSLIGSGLSPGTFDKIDSVRNAMLDSLNADACRDGGKGLQGCPDERPGYAMNMTRNAVPVKVNLRHYARATNAPVGGPGSPYEVIQDMVAGANTYLRTLSKLEYRMETIAKDEISPFLDAPSTDKAVFGIAPPAAPVYRLSELATIATTFRHRFDPTIEGSVAAKLDGKISRCWSKALEGAFEACATPSGESANTLPEAMAAAAEIDDYIQTGRIVPLRFAAKGVLRSGEAAQACSSATKRLPTYDEAQRLAIPIGYADLPRTTEDRLKFSAWHSDRTMCASSEFPVASNIPNGANGNLCTEDRLLSQHRTMTLCVPAGGPFDQLAAP
jgi:hypothetical protein